MSIRKIPVLALMLALTFALPAGRDAAVFAADPAKEQIDTFEDAMKDADDAAKVELIRQLAATGNPGAAKAISSHVRDRNLEVRLAAIQALATLKDPKLLSRLIGMIDMFEDDPKTLAAVVFAIGEYRERKASEPVVDVAKKWLPKDPEVASAAARALGRIPARENIEELIKLLDLTYPKAGSGGTISQETRDLYAKSRPAIISALQELTGWDFTDARAWENFFEMMGKRWKPEDANPPDYEKIERWQDPGYRFAIDKPAAGWTFAPLEGCRISLVWKDESKTIKGRVYIQVFDTANVSTKTADGRAQEREAWYRDNWKDIKQETYAKDDLKVGREKGVMYTFKGLDENGTITWLKNVAVVHNGFMFEIGSTVRSGENFDELQKQVEKAIGSFRFTD